MDAEPPEVHDWRPVSDRVAGLLGRVTFYAAWLDDSVSEIIVGTNVDLSDHSSLTPGWASSGKALVAALRRTRTGTPQADESIGKLADRLEDMNAVRNQLVHGVWLPRQGSVVVMKRSLDQGPRSIDYGTYDYAELELLIEEYRRLGRLADRFVEMLHAGNPVHREREQAMTPKCPTDVRPMESALSEDDEIVWLCPMCGYTESASIADRSAFG